MKTYDHVLHDGHVVDRITDAALKEAERRLGYSLTILQGSYNHGGVGASAGTHDGGGAVDLSPYDWKRKVTVLREIGFAAWHRPAIPGLWVEHIHAILIGNANLSPAAEQQVHEYLLGQNGLANHGADDFPRPHPVPRFVWVADWKTRGYNIDHALSHLAHSTSPADGRRFRLVVTARKHLRALPQHTSNKPWRHDSTNHRIHLPSRGREIDAALDHVAWALANTKSPVRKGRLILARRALRKIGHV